MSINVHVFFTNTIYIVKIQVNLKNSAYCSKKRDFIIFFNFSKHTNIYYLNNYCKEQGNKILLFDLRK